MKRRPAPTLALALALTYACGGSESSPERAGEGLSPLYAPQRFQETAPEAFSARFETTEGVFTVAVRRSWSPLGADRFYNLVKAGFYDGVRFHRVLEGFVVQFGIHDDKYVNAAWVDELIVDDPRVESNTRGRVAFAQGGPNSRTTQVVVHLRDNRSLDDQGFTPFGEVVEGMDVLERLHHGYGDGPPRGEGVYQARALALGGEYLDDFPELDSIVRATIVESGG